MVLTVDSELAGGTRSPCWTARRRPERGPRARAPRGRSGRRRGAAFGLAGELGQALDHAGGDAGLARRPSANRPRSSPPARRSGRRASGSHSPRPRRSGPPRRCRPGRPPRSPSPRQAVAELEAPSRRPRRDRMPASTKHQVDGVRPEALHRGAQIVRAADLPRSPTTTRRGSSARRPRITSSRRRGAPSSTRRMRSPSG